MRRYLSYLALFIILGGAALSYYVTQNSSGANQIFDAKLITTKSLYENYKYQLGTEYLRLIYEYPRDQVPSELEFFYVNITIPDNIANKLDQLAEKYPKLKDAFFPRVYAAALNPATPLRFNYYRPYFVWYREFTPNGIPKKITVKFKTSDVPSNAKYLVVSIHTPFFEDWDDNTAPFCYGIDGQVDPEGQWQGVKLERSICIEHRYDRNVYTSWRLLNEQEGNNGWSVLAREIDIPINPNKPLYMKWSVDYYETGSKAWLGKGVFIIGLEFELNNSETYFVAFRAWNNDYGVNPADPFNNIVHVDCAFGIDRNNEKLDIATYIQSNCNINWTNVRKLKKVYLALRDSVGCDYGRCGEGHTLLSYLWIEDQDFITNETAST